MYILRAAKLEIPVAACIKISNDLMGRILRAYQLEHKGLGCCFVILTLAPEEEQRRLSALTSESQLLLSVGKLSSYEFRIRISRLYRSRIGRAKSL